MNKQQIDFLRSLPDVDADGTVQMFLLHDEINHLPFEKVAMKLIASLYNEKHALIKDNIYLSGVAKECDDWK